MKVLLLILFSLNCVHFYPTNTLSDGLDNFVKDQVSKQINQTQQNILSGMHKWLMKLHSTPENSIGISGELIKMGNTITSTVMNPKPASLKIMSDKTKQSSVEVATPDNSIQTSIDTDQSVQIPINAAKSEHNEAVITYNKDQLILDKDSALVQHSDDAITLSTQAPTSIVKPHKHTSLKNKYDCSKMLFVIKWYWSLFIMLVLGIVFFAFGFIIAKCTCK